MKTVAQGDPFNLEAMEPNERLKFLSTVYWNSDDSNLKQQIIDYLKKEVDNTHPNPQTELTRLYTMHKGVRFDEELYNLIYARLVEVANRKVDLMLSLVFRLESDNDHDFLDELRDAVDKDVYTKWPRVELEILKFYLKGLNSDAVTRIVELAETYIPYEEVK